MLVRTRSSLTQSPSTPLDHLAAPGSGVHSAVPLAVRG